jgi:adenine-specific DNA-methyltransferase
MPFLQFKGKTAVESYHHSVAHHTLEFDGKLSVLGKSERPGLDGNLIIEGDNLLALKSLLPTHAGRIKCVYIDPPYNTGNEGWVYNDNLTQPQFKEWIGQVVGKEGEDATRHDKWCCMIYPRLQLLKELLRDDGVIFVSIDDNEAHHLRMIMDEVFGAESFLTALIWKTRNTDNRVKTMLSVDHEYVLVYSMNKSPIQGRIIDRSDFSNPDKDPRGPYVTDPLTGKATSEERPNLHFVITNPVTGDKYPPDPSRGWITDQKGFSELLRQKLIWWPPNPKTGKPRKKRFLSETSERMPASSFWPDLKGQSGADEVDRILGERLFAFPKSLEFMERILDLGAGRNDIVLDSTAGSGTTAHAVLKLNKEDGGNRKCILVQIPYETKEQEKNKFNICQKITLERVQRVIQGYTYTTPKGKKEKVAGLGGSFTYARVGDPLFGEYRDFGKKLPAYEELAKYIFYTETSRDFDHKAMNEKTGKIGEHSGTSYYLLYTPNGQEDRQLDLPWLETLQKTDKNRSVVVYCEKIHVHRDDLAKYEQETKRTVRPMVVPFNLK